MTTKLIYIASIFAITVLTSCSSIGITNPFGSKATTQPGVPKDSVAYLCQNNKSFYVQMQKNGDAWLIYPDHEVNLTRTSDNANRYTSGAIALLINGAETTLNDGEKVAYTACKPQMKK